MLIEIILICCLILSIILYSMGVYFYKVAFKRGKKDVISNDEDYPSGMEGKEGWEWGKAEGRKWLSEKQFQKVKIKSEDELRLVAHYLPSESISEVTVILLHGYGSTGLDMGTFAKYYNEEWSFNVLMLDCRGYGDSQGLYTGFGWHDRRDIIKWINYLMERNGDKSKIILHGVSMGAAAVLMTSGEELPENVKFIIGDCGYSSVKDILAYQLNKKYKLPAFPILNITSLVCKMKAGYFIGEASAVKQVKKSKTPILFIHGTEDKFVPVYMTKELYEAAECPKELLLVEGAVHAEAYYTDKENYKNKIRSYIERYLK